MSLFRKLAAMYAGDRARKENLVDFGFRLPSAVDNRPLQFEEFEKRVGQTIYTTATPGPYEKEHSGKDGGANHSPDRPRRPRNYNASRNCEQKERLAKCRIFWTKPKKLSNMEAV